MPSRSAPEYALDRVEETDAARIAPQHGSILHTRIAQDVTISQLRMPGNVGIDDFLAR